MVTTKSVVNGLSAAAVLLVLTACTAERVGTSSAGSVSTTTDTATTATPQGPYVALGDSYTSGPGIPTQTGDPAGCQRSSDNYPALVARGLGLSAADVRDVSCSGATTADLTAAQSTSDGTNAAQLDALSASTALVTLGIGGNDVDFAGVLTRCTELGLIPSLIGGTASSAAPCQAYYTSGGTDQIQRKIQTASGRITDALQEVKNRAPHARVYVVGYPALIPASGTSCAHALGITEGDEAFLHAEEVRLNDMLRQRAEAAGATYVDTFTPSVGHDACTDAATRWVEPLLVSSPAAPLHPNARGEQAMADAVLRAIKSNI